MKYSFDHDFHIHTFLSLCSGDPEQTVENIVKYAIENNLKQICITNHLWDKSVPGASEWYKTQDFKHISKILPLPENCGPDVLFGAETEFTKDCKLCISGENLKKLDFLIIPITHLHLCGVAIDEENAKSTKGRAKTWINKFRALLNMELPFEKIGLAHLATPLIAPTHEEYIEVLKLLPEAELKTLFEKAANLGVGIELNSHDMSFADEDSETVLRIFKIAKQSGCKFYLGSDAHHLQAFENIDKIFKRAVDLLELTEEDKFHINKRRT